MQDAERILLASQQLRAHHQFKEAHELVEGSAQSHGLPQDYIWAHQPILWSDISAGICQLTRRKKEDAEFLMELWRNKDFIREFHRHAKDLTTDPSLLCLTLEREYTSLLSEINQLHWVVRDRKGQAFGLLSLTNVSISNKSAEVLLGVLPQAPMGLATASMLILFQFFFKAMGFINCIHSFMKTTPIPSKAHCTWGSSKKGC